MLRPAAYRNERGGSRSTAHSSFTGIETVPPQIDDSKLASVLSSPDGNRNKDNADGTIGTDRGSVVG